MGYQITPNFMEIDIESEAPVISLPYDKHPPRMLDGRGEFLPNATEIALKKLDNNNKGFFLMVEGSQIDWAGHNNDIDYAVTEVIDLDNAIGKAYDFADKNPGTLVIVTADHETGGLALLDGSVENKTVEAIFATKGHTGVMVPVYAYGAGASNFSAIMENTEIFIKIATLLGVETVVDEPIVEEK